MPQIAPTSSTACLDVERGETATWEQATAARGCQRLGLAQLLSPPRRGDRSSPSPAADTSVPRQRLVA